MCYAGFDISLSLIKFGSTKKRYMDEGFSLHLTGQVSKSSPTPLYYQLFSLLKARILDGTLALGLRLPPEEQLADLFKVSRITAKRAMDDLAAEGLVERQRGRGTHVIFQYSPRPAGAPLTGMLQEIERTVGNSSAQILDYGMRVPPQEIREDLRLADGETALHLLQVRERDGMKFGHYSSWTARMDMPADPAIFENTPRLSYYRQQGLEVSHATQTLSAVSADASVADALDVAEGNPLLSLTRRSYQKTGTGDEQILDFLEVLCNPAHFQWSMDLTLD